MPFTPLHFGPGLALNAAAPRAVNWPAFCLANIIIDLEPAYFILTHNPPLHRTMHTLGGATVAFGATVLAWTVIRRVGKRAQVPNWGDWRGENQRAVWLGALLGAYSHVVLDAFLYSEMRLLWPLGDGNPLLGVVSFATVYLFCVLMWGVGLGWWGVRWAKRALA